MDDRELLEDISSVDLLRAFGISIVVLRHCFAPYTGAWKVDDAYEYSVTTDVIGRYISTISMPLFVFISGFVYSYLRNHHHKYPTFAVLVQKKIRRLMVPYLLFAPVYTMAFLEFQSPLDVVRWMAIGPGHLWFLLMMFISFLAFYSLEFYFKRHVPASVGILLLLYCSAPLFYSVKCSIVGRVCTYAVFFYMGYLFYYRNQEVMALIKDKLRLGLLLHFLCFELYIVNHYSVANTMWEGLISHFAMLPLGVLSITCCYLLFVAANKGISIAHRRRISAFNAQSYYVYLFHQPILKLLFRLDAAQRAPAYGAIVVGFVVSMTVSLLLGKILLSYKVGRRLIGA